MAKLTVLQMTQKILSSMDSDDVNSINDTVEAQQVVDVLEIVYFEIITSRVWPHLKQLDQLDGLSDSTKPNYMKLPENVSDTYWVKYDKQLVSDTRTKMLAVGYLPPDEFMELLDTRLSSAANVTSIAGFNSVPLLIKTDTAPTYWTSFDDEYIVFDSYDSDVDSTLQASKSQVYVYKEASWTSSNGFVPDLPSKNFPFLLAEAKSVCSLEIRQIQNIAADRASRRQRTWSAREKFRENGDLKIPDFGRK